MPSVLCMRTIAPARLLLGCVMLLAGLGLVLVGVRWFVERGVQAGLALDGSTLISPAQYVAPWSMAFVLVAASVYLLRGARDRVF